MFFIDPDWRKIQYKNSIIYGSPLNFEHQSSFARKTIVYDSINEVLKNKNIIIDFNSINKSLHLYDYDALLDDLLFEIKNLNYTPTILIIDIDEPRNFKNLKKFLILLNQKIIDIKDLIILSPCFYDSQNYIKNMGIFNSAFNYFKPDLFHDIFFNPTHHYIALARCPRLHRVKFIVKILEKNLYKFGHISCGFDFKIKQTYTENEGKSFLNYLDNVPDKFKHFFPLQVDDLNVANFNNHIVNDKIKNAFLNIVFETGYEFPNSIQCTTITEKSGKPFFWGQVPLFLSGQYTIKFLRELDFDFFDDLIDHSYDLEPNPYKRMNKVLEQLIKITEIPIDELIAFKSKHIDRFVKNREIALSLYKGKTKEILENNLRKLLNN